MTIRKGQEWGRIVPAPDALVVAEDDAALFALLNRADPPTVVGLRSGDLARTCGAPGGAERFLPGREVVEVMVDVATVRHDGGRHRFAAHLVARRSWWRGEVLGVCNAQYLGRWDVAPRAHPNDGRLDVVEVAAAMPVRQRLAARRRLPTAGHVPHPDITVRRVAEGEWRFARPLDLWLDGVRVGPTTWVAVTLEADALRVCV